MLSRKIAAALITGALTLNTVSIANAQQDVVQAQVPKNMVSIVIPGIKIPGQPENQILFPKMPTVEQVRKESGRIATQLDALIVEFNKFVDSQRRALDDLNKTERELTQARNDVHIAMNEFGRASKQHVQAQQEFTAVRNDVKERAKDGDQEAKDALTKRESKAKQRSATAVDMLETRDEIATNIEKSKLDDSQFVEPAVTEDGFLFVGSDDEKRYYAAEDTEAKKSEKKSQRKSENTQRKTHNIANSSAASSDKDDKRKQHKEAKEQRERELVERAVRVYGIPANREDSPLYGFGSYEQPVGVPSMILEEHQEGYGALAHLDIRDQINAGIREYDDLKDSVKKLRNADKDNDEEAFAQAREEIQPIIEKIAHAMYGWDDDLDPRDAMYRTVIGEGAPFDPYANPAHQEAFEDFVIDAMTTPSKLAKRVEKENKKIIEKHNKEKEQDKKEKA